MRDLDWDVSAVHDFFDYNALPYSLEDDDGTLFTITDGVLRAEVVVLPVRSVIAFSILLEHTNEIVVDVSILAQSKLECRDGEVGRVLYCHECVVIPGIRSYRRLDWYSFFEYHQVRTPILSVQLGRKPVIGLKFLDLRPETRH